MHSVTRRTRLASSGCCARCWALPYRWRPSSVALLTRPSDEPPHDHGRAQVLTRQDDIGRLLYEEVLAGSDVSVDAFIRGIEAGMAQNALWEPPPKPVNER